VGERNFAGAFVRSIQEDSPDLEKLVYSLPGSEELVVLMVLAVEDVLQKDCLC
jgi:hypothetical protein